MHIIYNDIDIIKNVIKYSDIIDLMINLLIITKRYANYDILFLII